jgi:chromosome segregation protein
VNSSAYDRKLLIEEAVGIVKYKTRKMEAERKLEKAQNNLYRITDILAELETRLPSLKRQSEKAEKFLAYRNELKDIEINIFVHQMENLNARLSKYTEDRNAISESLHGIDTELTSLDSRYTVLKNDVSMYDESIAELNERIHELITNFENSKTEISVSKSKVESYETSIVDAQKEIAESVQESETLHKSEAEISSELQTALQSLESAKRI